MLCLIVRVWIEFGPESYTNHKYKYDIDWIVIDCLTGSILLGGKISINK